MIINIPLIAIIISIAACIYASYSDLRWGIIPNKLTFPLIGVRNITKWNLLHNNW